MLLRYNLLFIVFLMFQVAFTTCGGSLGADSIGHKPRLREPRSISASFDQLGEVLRDSSHDARMIIYRGLPRRPTDKTDDARLKRDQVVRRYGEEFYPEPVPTESETQQSIGRVLVNPDSYRRFNGFKFCGGFHPDFAIVLQVEGGEIEFQFCQTCQEMKVFRGRKEVYCDVQVEAYKTMKSLLSKLKQDH